MAVIKVDDCSKVYGQDDPAFTGTVYNLEGNDELGDITYFREDIDSPNAEDPGSHPISANVENINTKYDYTVQKGTLTIIMEPEPPSGGGDLPVTP